jgi:hypothetical protein
MGGTLLKRTKLWFDTASGSHDLGRGSQVVRQGSAKALCVGSIPTLASKFCCLSSKELRKAERPLSVKLSVKGCANSQFATIRQNFTETRQNSRS